MKNKVIYLPSKYSITKAPLLKNSLNEYELNILKVSEEGMFLKKGKVYIAINDGLRNGEVLQIGGLETKYKIVEEDWFTQKGNRSYRIERFDGTLIQGIDIENAKKGAKVTVLSRKPDSYYIKMVNKE